MRTPVPLGLRSETIRRANLSVIVRELHDAGRLSRSGLVARTGLTRTAIRDLIGELASADLVSEQRASSSGAPGRPSPVVRLNPQRAVVLALEISVDSLAAALVGLGGQVIHAVRIDRPRGHSTVDEVIADLAGLSPVARSMDHENLIGIGVTIVGVVRRSDGLVSMAPNLGWRDVPLGERLSRVLQHSAPIFIGNDADLGALAEMRRGAARGVSQLLYVSGEVGVGGGIVIDEKPLMGVAGYGGEIGHFPVNPIDGSTCGCGAIGCWETEVGEGALLVRAGYPADGGRPAVEAVLAEAAAGDRRALGALEDHGRWLGIGLAGLVNLLDPAVIVLGGRFARLHPFVAATIEEELDRRALQAPRALVRVVPAALGVDAPLLGAAELAFEPLLADPAGWSHRGSPLTAAAGA